jgi:hypothetical protein
MKKLIFLSFMAVFAICAAGQNSENIVISIVSPKQVDNLDASQTASLGKKMLNAASKSGMVNTDRISGIIMYPVFTINAENEVEGGMRNLKVIDADISFIVKNLDSEKVFATYNLQIRGSGTTRQHAINSAISNISVKGADFDSFIVSARRKIMDYYTENCSSIQATAQSYAKQQDYETAIALLASIPEATACYSQALQKLEPLYRDYQKHRCNELLQQAQSLYAGHQYMDALSILQDLRVFDSDCSREAKALSAKIEVKLTEDEKREWALAEQKAKSKTAIAEKTIDAVSNIATAFFNRKINRKFILF